VAAMAGFPPSVITEAKRKAAELELQGDCAVPGEYYLYTYCFIFVG
jgi:DNA mismatch repair ATPase MutS